MVLAESIGPTMSKYILPASGDVRVGNHGQIARVAVGNQTGLVGTEHIKSLNVLRPHIRVKSIT